MDLVGSGCDICGEGHSTEQCPELGLSSDSVQVDQLSTRARLTLPSFLEVVDNGNGLVGVVAKETIPNKTQLGPFEAKRTTHVFDDTNFFTLKLLASDGTTVCLDTTDENECNWLCLVRTALTTYEQNCMAYQLGSNIFYNTTKDVGPGEELAVWYAPHFGRKLGKPSAPDMTTKVLLGHRIEPLANELVIDLEVCETEISEDGTRMDEQAVAHTDSQNTQEDVDNKVVAELLPGEIRKAFYCPRCGNTFGSQTEMVLHLREHIIRTDQDDSRKRPVGRPRKHPIKDPTAKKARGRPKKPKANVEILGSELVLKKTDKTYSRKRKRKSSGGAGESVGNRHGDVMEGTVDESADVDIMDHGDDDDDYVDHVMKDLNDYFPKKEVAVTTVIVTNARPRRSTQGKNRKFDSDYILENIKQEPSSPDESLDFGEENDVETKIESETRSTVTEEGGTDSSNLDKSLKSIVKVKVGVNSLAEDGKGKRKRGRPRKQLTSATESLQILETGGNSCNEKERLTADMVKESLAALNGKDALIVVEINELKNYEVEKSGTDVGKFGGNALEPEPNMDKTESTESGLDVGNAAGSRGEPNIDQTNSGPGVSIAGSGIETRSGPDVLKAGTETGPASDLDTCEALPHVTGTNAIDNTSSIDNTIDNDNIITSESKASSMTKKANMHIDDESVNGKQMEEETLTIIGETAGKQIIAETDNQTNDETGENRTETNLEESVGKESSRGPGNEENMFEIKLDGKTAGFESDTNKGIRNTEGTSTEASENSLVKERNEIDETSNTAAGELCEKSQVNRTANKLVTGSEGHSGDVLVVDSGEITEHYFEEQELEIDESSPLKTLQMNDAAAVSNASGNKSLLTKGKSVQEVEIDNVIVESELVIAEKDEKRLVSLIGGRKLNKRGKSTENRPKDDKSGGNRPKDDKSGESRKSRLEIDRLKEKTVANKGVDGKRVVSKEMVNAGKAGLKDVQDVDNAMKGVVSKESETGAEKGSSKSLTMHDKGSMVVMFEETGDGKYGCVLCSETFVEEINAISHFMDHNQNESGVCSNCNREFNSFNELLQHRKKCTNSENSKKRKRTQEEELESIAKGYAAANGEATFVCDICKQAFKSAQYLYRHMVMHTDMYTCVRCNKTFSRKDSLQKHVLKCCPDLASFYKIYYCDICLRVFSKEAGLQRHKVNCLSVQCADCKKTFAAEADKAIHKCQAIDSDDTARYACGQCFKSFQSMYYLNQHRLMHSNLHACKRCGRNMANKEDLETHITLCATLESIRLYGSGRCSQCQLSFTNSKAFREHAQSHSHPYQCSQCEKRFVKIGTLSNHDCGASIGFTCSVCQRGFRNEVSLEKHTNEHECMPYQCSACCEFFHLKTKARDHIAMCTYEAEGERRIVKRNEVLEMCTTCGKSFSSRSNLTKHMLLHGEKNYACPHCEKKFHLDVYLKEHITCVHYNIFKYQCNACGRMMKSKTGLVAHNRLFHCKDGETFDCPKCNKTFKQKGNLRAHMYSHTTERKFTCDLCVRAFKYPDQLSRHKREHKMSYKLGCPDCHRQFIRGYDLKRHIQVDHSGCVYICDICNARCCQRHTMVRHYKRKHPDQVHLLSKEGYVKSLWTNVSTLPDAGNNNSAAKLAIPETDVEMLPQEAAEALRDLGLGTATTRQYQLLKDKGLLTEVSQQDVTLVNDHQNIIVPQDSYIIQNSDIAGGQIVRTTVAQDGIGTMDEGLQNAVGMVQNVDGSFSINGVQGLPHMIDSIDSTEGQIVILQIVDPETQEQTVETIQHQFQDITTLPEAVQILREADSDDTQITQTQVIDHVQEVAITSSEILQPDGQTEAQTQVQQQIGGHLHGGQVVQQMGGHLQGGQIVDGTGSMAGQQQLIHCNVQDGSQVVQLIQSGVDVGQQVGQLVQSGALEAGQVIQEAGQIIQDGSVQIICSDDGQVVSQVVQQGEQETGHIIEPVEHTVEHFIQVGSQEVEQCRVEGEEHIMQSDIQRAGQLIQGDGLVVGQSHVIESDIQEAGHIMQSVVQEAGHIMQSDGLEVGQGQVIHAGEIVEDSVVETVSDNGEFIEQTGEEIIEGEVIEQYDHLVI